MSELQWSSREVINAVTSLACFIQVLFERNGRTDARNLNLRNESRQTLLSGSSMEIVWSVYLRPISQKCWHVCRINVQEAWDKTKGRKPSFLFSQCLMNLMLFTHHKISSMTECLTGQNEIPQGVHFVRAPYRQHTCESRTHSWSELSSDRCKPLESNVPNYACQRNGMIARPNVALRSKRTIPLCDWNQKHVKQGWLLHSKARSKHING